MCAGSLWLSPAVVLHGAGQPLSELCAPTVSSYVGKGRSSYTWRWCRGRWPHHSPSALHWACSTACFRCRAAVIGGEGPPVAAWLGTAPLAGQSASQACFLSQGSLCCREQERMWDGHKAFCSGKRSGCSSSTLLTGVCRGPGGACCFCLCPGSRRCIAAGGRSRCASSDGQER